MEEQREELVLLAQSGELCVSEVCRRVGVSRQTFYKWKRRAGNGEGFGSHSRRPHSSPSRSPEVLEQAVVALRMEHPAWGGRKLRRVLEREGRPQVPSASTVTQILRRHGLLGTRAGEPRDVQRFEREAPNELWQMDFKGHFAMKEGRCHPLTVLDDHSRYSLGLESLPNEQKRGVRESLENIFRVYGLPDAMLFDNGGPWGSPSQGELGEIAVWLTLLGVRAFNGRARHPQTQGKLERFHRTLKAEVLQGRWFSDLADCQRSFDAFRHTYNHRRPHEALDLDVPASRYRPSRRGYPGRLPEPEYGPDCLVRKVQQNGVVHFKGLEFLVPKALTGQPIGFRQVDEDLWEVRFCARVLAQARLGQNPKRRITVNDVSEQV